MCLFLHHCRGLSIEHVSTLIDCRELALLRRFSSLARLSSPYCNSDALTPVLNLSWQQEGKNVAWVMFETD